jgi:hypothetical protein
VTAADSASGSSLTLPRFPWLDLATRPSTEEENQTERAEEPEPDEIETDRDSFTPAVSTAPRGRFILESAYSFLNNSGGPETHSFPEMLLRYGLTKRIEFRLGWNYEVGGGANVVSELEGGEGLVENGRVARESRILYGIKARINEQQNWLPESTLLVQAFTPTSGDVTATLMVATYVFGWNFPNRWKLDASIRYGMGSDEVDRFDVWAPSIVLKIPVQERIKLHAEYFGLISSERAEPFSFHFFSPGIHYLLNDDFEFGIRLGWGLNDQSARFFTNVGFGYRF